MMIRHYDRDTVQESANLSSRQERAHGFPEKGARAPEGEKGRGRGGKGATKQPLYEA